MEAPIHDSIVIRGAREISTRTRSRRSNPATYTGMLDPIRKAFAAANGVSAALFSANSEGACPDCAGLGVVYTDLVSLDPVVSTCEACEGRRFTNEVLQHELLGASIADVFDMPADAELEFFTERPVRIRLEAMRDVALGYVTLGQPRRRCSCSTNRRRACTCTTSTGSSGCSTASSTGRHGRLDRA